MYQQFYGLRERPFDLNSNPKYLLMTPKHQEALSNLAYGITSGNGITLLLGEAGTGKTTLLRKAVASEMRCRGPHVPVRWACLTNPRLTSSELLESLSHAFQIEPPFAGSKSMFLRALEQNLLDHHEKGILSVLVADEAQSLPDDLLEEVRLLANIETDTEKLLRVVLAGQPALGDRLNAAGFTQLKQRIGLRCSLPPLDLRETAIYIAHRITLAGGDPARAFSREAVLAIYEESRGIPRTINVICENALLTGFAADERPIGRGIVLEVSRDFDLADPVDHVPIQSRSAVATLPANVATTPFRKPLAPASSRTGTAAAGAARALSFLISRAR
jgi:general secretion pathway protein A